MAKRSPSNTSTSSSSSVSPYHDDSSDIDELDHRSRKLTKILKKNINRTEKRRSVLDVVRDKAWLLEDQVKLLEKQTATVRSSLNRQSCLRRIIVFMALIVSVILIINRSILSGLYETIDRFLHRSHDQHKERL